MSDFWKFIILIIGSYFLGNFTFARFLARTRNNDDITTHGSGNPGTMNMLRTHGLWLAVVTLVFDALKGVISCLAGYLWLKYTSTAYAASVAMYTCGLACVVGHMWPIIFKFKGGKGVATGFGVACVVNPILIGGVVAVFLTIFLIWRMGSVASLTTVILFGIADSIFLLSNQYYMSFILLVLIVTLIVYAHRENIKRVFENRESKIDLDEAVQKDKDFAEEQKRKRMQRLRKDKKVVVEAEVAQDNIIDEENKAE